MAIACVLASLGASCRKSSTAQPLIQNVQVQLGVGGVIDDQQWTVVRIDAQNQGADFRGRVRLQGLASDPGSGLPTPTAVSYARDIEIPQGTRRSIEIPARYEDWEAVTVRFEGRGYFARSRHDLATPKDAFTRFLFVGDKVPAVESLLRAIEGRFSKSSTDDGISDRLAATARQALPEELPTSSLAYESCSVVVLYRTDLANAPPRAIRALEEWVSRGGTLLAFPSEGWTGDGAEELRRLLRVKAGAVGAAMPARFRQLFGATADTFFYRELSPDIGATIDDDGTKITARRGAGRLVTFTFTPTGRRLPPETECQQLYALLLPEVARALSFGGNANAALRAIERGAASSLFAMTGFRIPSGGAIFLGVLVYLLLGFFLPGFVFKKIGRREWTFVWILAASILATASIYFFGLLAAIDGPEVEEISVVRLHPDGQTGRATSLVGLISPRLRGVEAGLEDRHAGETASIAQPLRGRQRASKPFESDEVIHLPSTETAVDPQTGDLSLPPVTLFPNGPRYFRFDYRHDVGDLVELTASDEPNEFARVENRSDAPLHLLVVQGLKAKSVGTLEGGEAKVLSEGEVRPKILFQGSTIELATSPREESNEVWFDDGAETEAVSSTEGLPSDSIGHDVIHRVLWSIAQPDDSEYDLAATSWGGGTDMEATKRPGDALLKRQPRFLVAWSRAPIFPGAREIDSRKAWTVFVLEIPR